MSTYYTGCKPVSPRNIVIDIRGIGGITPNFKLRYNGCSDRRHHINIVVYEGDFEVLLKEVGEAADWPAFIYEWAINEDSPGLCMDWPRRCHIR